jgi:nuclear pore complex protein Nup205
MVLLLLWRHITYYCEFRHINNPNMKVSSAAVLRSVSQPNDGEAFREEAAKRLTHALHHLGQLNLVSIDVSGNTGNDTAVEQDDKWRDSRAYIEIMSRRIREIVGLQVEDDEANGIIV